MTLGELIAAFRRDEDDNRVPPLWADADLTKWFNEAQEEACVRASLIFDDSSAVTELALTAGASAVAIDPSIIAITKARIVDSGGRVTYLWPSDRIEQDRRDPRWRETTGLPTAFIHNDKSVTFNRIAEASYTVRFEVYRLPSAPMVGDDDEPEIAAPHHARLVDWVRHKAYSIPDSDLVNVGKAQSALVAFEGYFGPRPQANESRARYANRPHRVKAW